MKVAILIPTINRPEFIERTVKYYNSIESKHPIYIGDASDDITSNKIKLFLQGFTKVDVRYFHWKGLGLNQTHKKLIEEVSPEFDYCAYQGDDDFFIPKSLTKCSEFLSHNPDYRTAQGYAALVCVDRPEPVSGIDSIGQYWGKNSLDHDSKMDRLLYFDQNYYVTQFSVHRVHEYIADIIDSNSIADTLIGELTHSYTFALNGKSKFIDSLYLVRVRHSGLQIYSGFNFFDWIGNKNWSSDYVSMIDSLSKHLCVDTDISPYNAREIVSNIMKKKLIRNANSSLGNSITHKRNIFTKIKVLLPKSIKFKIKFLMYYFSSNRARINNINMELELLRDKTSRFYNDFLPVEDSLTKNNLPKQV